MLARLFIGIVISVIFLSAQVPSTSKAPRAVSSTSGTEELFAVLRVAEGDKPLGEIAFKLYEKEAPITVKNFVDLALGKKVWKDPKTGKNVRRPFYDGLTFHRIIPDFMIQGGDPLGNGSGSTDPIPNEYHPTLKFDRVGRVAMANAGGDKTGSCQFFITVANQERLNGLYTIFGQVISGQELVDRLSRVPTGPNDKPIIPIRIYQAGIGKIKHKDQVQSTLPKR